MSSRPAQGNPSFRIADRWSDLRNVFKHYSFRVLKAFWQSMTFRRMLVGAVAASAITPGHRDWRALLARWGLFKDVAWSIPEDVYRRASISRPLYVAVRLIDFTATRYPEDLQQRPLNLLGLFTADILKLAGFFAEAEHLLGRLLLRPSLRNLAVLSLGDLLLVQAGWTAEVAAYEADDFVREIGSFAWTRPLSPGWRRVSFERVLDVLAAGDAGSCSPDRFWLRACALMQSGSWAQALPDVHAYTAVKPPDYPRQLAETRATYAASREAGLQKAITNSGRWIGMLDVREVEITSLSDGLQEDVLRIKQVEELVTVIATPRGVYRGKVVDYVSEFNFGPVYDAEYRNAEILPSFGMIRAGSCLIAESGHLKREHWQNYTPSIIALREDNALLCRRQPSRFAESFAYYFGNSRNYYHWIIEDMPRLLYIQENHSEANGYFLVDHLLTNWQQDVLLRLGSDPLRWRSVDFLAPTVFPQLVAPSLYSKNLCAHPKAVEMLRRHLVPDVVNVMPRAGNRFYLARKGKEIRPGRLINEQEVIRLFENAGFVVVNTADLTFAHQIELFRHAEVIAGPGGAAFTNMIFAPSAAKILVLAPSGAHCETFVSIAAAIGQEIITCLGDSRPSPNPAWINTPFDFSIHLADVRLALDLLGC